MTLDLVPPFVVLADAVIAALGGAIALFAYRAYRRTGLASMRLFAVGFLLVTASLLFGGVLGVGSGTVGLVARAALAVAGLGLLAGSLYVARTDEVRDGDPAR